MFDITDEKHLTRIQNMIILQESIDDTDLEYAQNFLLSQLAQQKNTEQCMQLLPGLYNRKAEEYRKKAEYYAKEALELFPHSHCNHSNLNEAQQGATGDWNLDNQAERILYYKEFLKKHPESKEGWRWYLGTLLSVGRFEEAREALEIFKKLSEKDGEETLRGDIYHGQLLWAQGYHEEALKCFDRITAQHSDKWMAWSYAGDTYGKACLYEKAIECYRQSMVLQPKPRYTDAPMAIAQICEITGDTAGAIDAWKAYIRILNEDWNTMEGTYIDRANRKIQELRE